MAILLTRFWFTPLAPAVNVLAGGRFPYRRFLAYYLAGELWVLLYDELGYLFAAQLQRANLAIGLAALAGVLVGFFFAARPLCNPSAC